MPQKTAPLTLARFLPAALVGLPALLGVWDASTRAAYASLGRDQGIFQYVAWAVSNGDVAYRDVRDVNGPVIMMVHALFQSLGGTEEHRFRVLDLLCTAGSFAIAGALVPVAKLGPRVRAGWAFAATIALLAQYLVYGYWHTAQRESFLDWFVLVSVALLAAPECAKPGALALSGALSFLPWLGKPTYVLFSAAQLLALALERGRWRIRVARLAWFGGGGLVGLGLPIGYLLVRGDVRRWAAITFVDVPAMYRFIWPRPALDILTLPGYSTTALTALVTTVALGGLIAARRLSVRALPIALLPVLGLVSVVAQAKGFPYHFHPVTLGSTYGWIVALAVLGEELGVGWLRRGIVAVAALAVGVRAALLAANNPFPPAPPPAARHLAALESRERLDQFDLIDFFPGPLREGADYVATHTRPTDRVQLYAMDAYFLFLARRKSATPYIHAYDLNVDAALHGSFEPGGLRPTETEAARIRAMQAEHARDLLERLERDPPAAFVFIDRSPLMNWQDAVLDFSSHCAAAARWLGEHYRQTAVFDGVRIWLRDDLAAAVAEERQ